MNMEKNLQGFKKRNGSSITQPKKQQYIAVKRASRWALILHATFFAFSLFIVSSCTASKVSGENENIYVPSISESVKKAMLFPFYVNGLWGYIDRSGKTVIPPQFKEIMRGKDFLMTFHSITKVLMDGNPVAIDRNGKPIFKPGEYDDVKIPFYIEFNPRAQGVPVILPVKKITSGG